MKKKSILIDCSSLKAGGGIQVALSFLGDIVLLKKAENFDLYLSKELEKIINIYKPNLLDSFNTSRTRRFPYFISVLTNIFWYKRFDLVFCLFGPPYFILKPKFLISGFARPWMIYTDIIEKKNVKLIKQKIKNLIHKFLLFKSDHLITETEHVKSMLINIKRNLRNEYISVVNNCLSSDFIRGSVSNHIRSSIFIKNKNEINLLYVGANYPHKNLKILASVFEKLSKDHNINTKFYVTLDNHDFNNFDQKLSKFSYNLGYIMPKNLGEIMKSADALIFPSLLECFSITPIEAMYNKLPLLCSDREFIREFCEDVPFYFEPTEETSIVNSILDFINSQNNLHTKINKGVRLAVKYKSSMIRTKKYLQIIETNISGTNYVEPFKGERHEKFF